MDQGRKHIYQAYTSSSTATHTDRHRVQEHQQVNQNDHGSWRKLGEAYHDNVGKPNEREVLLASIIISLLRMKCWALCKIAIQLIRFMDGGSGGMPLPCGLLISSTSLFVRHFWKMNLASQFCSNNTTFPPPPPFLLQHSAAHWLQPRTSGTRGVDSLTAHPNKKK